MLLAGKKLLLTGVLTPQSIAFAIAQKALERKTGARGLRSIIEKAMLNIMFEIPSNNSIKEIIITPEVIRDSQEPVVVHHNKALAS
jgi:ATP-dependent Clp protease ATP-binding subunit ClpX